MTTVLDDATRIRSGEEIDVARLSAFLNQQLGDGCECRVKQFPGGNSNLTYLVEHGGNDYVMRRPPFGNKVKSAHDMGREFRVLSKLNPVFRPAPKPAVYCEDESVIGAPFYLMERRQGIVLREAVPQDMSIDAPTARRMSEAFIDTLSELHSLNYKDVGLGDLGRPQGYTERQVRGWITRWQNVALGGNADVDRIVEWLVPRVPKETTAVIVHNDYKYDNMILDPADLGHVIAVLDWEMCTVGDPLTDLGVTLAYWTEANEEGGYRTDARSPTKLPGSLTRRELVERYGKQTGFDVSDLFFYYIFALFRLVGILQQIYFRYHEGHTQDQRFAIKGDQAKGVAAFAVRCIEKGEF